MPINYILIALQSLFTTVSILIAALIVLRLSKNRINRYINGKIQTVEARLAKAAPKIIDKMLENVDVGEIMGKLTQESGEGGLNQVLGAFGGGSKGGLGDLLQLLSSFSGVDQSAGENKSGKIGL